MTFLYIQHPSTFTKTANITIAFDFLSNLLIAHSYGDKENGYMQSIEIIMRGFPLSNWFSLYIHVPLHHLLQQRFEKRDVFLDGVGSIDLIKLHHILAREYADTWDTLVNLNQQVQLLYEKDDDNFSELLSEGISLSKKIKQGKTRLEQQQLQTSRRFYLIVTIISVLETMGQLSDDKALVIKQEMLQRPKAFIGKIAHIFCGIHGIDQKKMAKTSIDKKIDSVIGDILKLLHFGDNNDDLIVSVRNTLFKENYLHLVEKTYFGLFHVPYKAVNHSSDVQSTHLVECSSTR